MRLTPQTTIRARESGSTTLGGAGVGGRVQHQLSQGIRSSLSLFIASRRVGTYASQGFMQLFCVQLTGLGVWTVTLTAHNLTD